MKKAIIFDLDGTLLYTLVDLMNSFNFALESFGFEKISLEKTRNIVGYGVKASLLKATDNKGYEIIDKMYEVFKKHYEIHSSDNTTIYDGVMDTLKVLYDMNIEMAIVSNKYEIALKKLCEPLFGNYIKYMIGVSETNIPKPDPCMVNIALNKMNVKPSDCYYVGDSETDAKTASNCNIDCVLVTYGYRDYETLKNYNHIAAIDNLKKLVDIVKKENKND